MGTAMTLRPVRMGRLSIKVDRRADGTTIVASSEALGSSPLSAAHAVQEWAARTPDAVAVAERTPAGDWRRLSYGQLVESLPPLAQALLDAGLGPERPLAILSGNEIEHLLLGLAAISVGIPYAPISPAYSLLSTDFAKLKPIAALLTPGMVYATDGVRFADAIAAAFPGDVPVICRSNALPETRCGILSDLAATPVTEAVGRAGLGVTSDTVAKVLFTSGSTGMPKGVITTNRMMSYNQEMIRTALAFLRDEPPVLVDWMPWHHVAGGSHNIGIALYNGGACYIDDGQPTPGAIARTLRNLRDVSPTVYFSVPKGYEFLVSAFDRDVDLRRSFFSRLKLMQYAGASLSQHVFEGLGQAAQAELGERVTIITGYGSTETAPFAFTTTWPAPEAGHIGLPAPGMTIKLVPDGDKLEVRLKGPNVTPGYWRDEQKTIESFDQEGFYRIGDAVRPVDPTDYSRGFIFDGRVSEDFKLSTGTWVNFAAVRKSIIDACAPLIRDVVLTGADRNFLGALVFPDLDACRNLAGLPDGAEPDAVVSHPLVRGRIAADLADLAKKATGSSRRVLRALLMASPPSIDLGEATDKGSINQRAALSCRRHLVEQLYAEPPAAAVLHLTEKQTA